MARTYKVKGTNDFLYLAIALLLFGLWCLRDGWFPPESVLKKHPREAPASFARGGMIAELNTNLEASVSAGAVVGRLQTGPAEARLAEAQALYKAAEASHNEALMNAGPSADPSSALSVSRQALDAAGKALTAAREELVAHELRAPTNGVIAKVLKARMDSVKAGEPVLIVEPMDHFYLFNQSLAILCGLGMLISLGVHLVVK